MLTSRKLFWVLACLLTTLTVAEMIYDHQGARQRVLVAKLEIKPED